VGTANNDVWYRFVATATSHTVTVVGNANFDAVIQAYTLTSGSCPSATFTAISGTCTDNTATGGATETMNLTGLAVGVSYYVRVYHYYSAFPSTPGFSICVIAPPANDECTGAISLGTITSTCSNTTGDVNAATQSLPSGSCSFVSTARDVWYSFVATGTTANIAATGATGMDVVIQAYSGTCGSLTSIGCQQNWSQSTEVLGLTGLTNGQTYYVRVYHGGFSSLPTNTTFTLCVVIPPTNDECTGAIALTSGATLSAQSTLLASQTINGYYSSYYDDDDLWYSFIPSGNTARFTLTCSAGFDGVLELRSTTCNGFRNVARDFAAAAGSEVINVTNLTPGATYRLRVFSYGAVRGNFSILAQNGIYSPGTYDNVSNAFVSSVGANSPGIAFTTYGLQIGEPRGANWGFDYDFETGVELSNTSWFVFTPSITGQYTFSGTTGGNQFAMAVYSASNAAAMLTGGSTEVASALSSTTVSLAGTCLTAGTNYYVQFTGYAGAPGTPSLTIVNTTPLIAPLALAASPVSCTGFIANWSPAVNATSYVIDIATDPGFTSLVLTGANAGTGSSYEASGLPPSGTFYYRIRAVACAISTGDSNTIEVLTQPETVSASSNSTAVCDGQSFDLDAAGGSGANSWLWSGPNGYSASVQNPGAFNVTSLSAGNYFVTATNACGDAVSNSVSLTVNPLPGSSGAISGLVTVTIGTSGVAYDVPVIANATGYTWAYSGSGVTINGSDESVLLDFGLSATSGDLTVYGTNACGSSPDVATLSISVVNIQTYYKDFDGDGFSDGQTTESVSQPVGFYLAGQLIALSGDCNDDDADINPNSVWYLDADLDGYAFSSIQLCEWPGTGYSLTPAPLTDCYDSNALVNPTTIWYLDSDGDGYSVGSILQCDQLPGYVLIGSLFGFTDCDDTNSDVNPGADEWCNGVDDNCSGAADEGLGSDTYYEDADSDGSGNPAVSVTSCTSVIGYVLNDLDCDDDNASVSGTSVWYLDADGDGYASLNVVACGSPGVGYTSTLMETNDCDDNSFGVNPGVEEVCGNGIDDNCNGYFNEECAPAPANDVRTSSIAVLSYLLGSCVNTSGTVLNATVSTQANSIVVTGEDVWYRFTASSPGVSIMLSAPTFDGVIELQTVAGVTLDTENAVGTPGTEVLNYYNVNAPLTIGAVYYIAIRNNNSAFGTGAFDLCVQRIRATTCNSGPGPYAPSATFKAAFVGAWTYVFTFINTSTFQEYVLSSSGGTTIVSLASLPQGSTYNVSISCTYNLQNGAGVWEYITIPAPNVCQMSMSSPPVAPVLFLRTQDQCPVSKAPNAIVGANVWLSGALNYEWRFQQTAPTAGAWSAPVAGPPVNRFLNLFPIGLTPGATYNVQIRAVYSGGVTTNYGSTQCLKITAPGGMMLEENKESNDLKLMTEGITGGWDVSVYPNPSSGDQLNLKLSGLESDVTQIRIFDALGATVDVKQIVASDGTIAARPIYELASGVYYVEVIVDNERRTVRWIVSR